MSDQHPSVEDEIERALRLGLATVGQLADRYARARHDIARQAQHRSEQEALQLQARYRAESASAVARLAVLDRQEWWDRATPEEITRMWELAAQWREEQPGAAAAAATIARQVQDLYGVDVNAVGSSHGMERNDLGTAVAAITGAEQRDAAAARVAEDHSEGPRFVTGIQRDRAVPAYDSFERREQTAAGLREAKLSAETIAVAMRADVAHGRPAANAVSARATDPHTAASPTTVRRTQRVDRSR